MSHAILPHNGFARPLTEELRKHKRVFLSHRLADKPVARQLARYFEFLELHYYLDEEDQILQQMLAQGHSTDRGLVESTDAKIHITTYCFYQGSAIA